MTTTTIATIAPTPHHTAAKHQRMSDATPCYFSTSSGSSKDVFCSVGVWPAVVRVTLRCEQGEATGAATFGCWAHARPAGTTIDTDTLLGASASTTAQAAELLARVLCERLGKEVVLSLYLPRSSAAALDLALLRRLADIATSTVAAKTATS